MNPSYAVGGNVGRAGIVNRRFVMRFFNDRIVQGRKSWAGRD